LKILDLYIIRKFLTSFFFALLLFSVIASVFDLTEKIDDFLERSVPISEIIFDYYFNFIPFIDAMLTPLFIFISVIFFTSRMAYNSEIIAILASGVSYYRLLVPYMIVSAFLALLLLAANHYGVPKTNKDRLTFQYTYINNPYRNFDRNYYMQVEKNKYIYMENYNPKDSIGYKFSYEVIKDGNLEYKLRADRIKWLSDVQKWSVKNYYIREFNRVDEKITEGARMDTALNFKPTDFVKRLSFKEEMNSAELSKYIKTLQLRGAENIEYYQIELIRRTADAFMIFILVLIGLAMASQRARGGSGYHIALGFLLSALFIVSTRFSTTFSTNGNLSPFLSIWIPNVMFLFVAIYLTIRAPK